LEIRSTGGQKSRADAGESGTGGFLGGKVDEQINTLKMHGLRIKMDLMKVIGAQEKDCDKTRMQKILGLGQTFLAQASVEDAGEIEGGRRLAKKSGPR